MRSIDVSGIEAAMATLDQESQKDKEAFHQIENWRDSLIAEPELVKEFIDKYPQTDIQGLRQQLRLYQSAKKSAQKTKASRQLFQIIKTTLGDAN